MGYSTIEIDKDTALELAKTKEVCSASHISYFMSQPGKWKRIISSAEQKDNGDLIFKLSNGDFVEME